MIWLLVLLLLVAVPVEAQTPFNTPEQTSGVNASQSIILVPLASSQSVRLFDFGARCSAGTATLTILLGATTFRSYPSLITTTLSIGTFNPFPLIATKGQTLTLTVTSCGGGNTSTLSVRADSN